MNIYSTTQFSIVFDVFGSADQDCTVVHSGISVIIQCNHQTISV